MAQAHYISDQTTAITSNVSIGGTDGNNNVYGNLWVGSSISAPSVTVLTATYTSGISASRVTASSFLNLQSSVATADFAQGTVLSWRTIAASSLTASAANGIIRDRELLLVCGGASGVSLAFRSNGTTYIFNSAISAAGA